ncbi:MAG: hypothetical protein RJQ03_02875 [Miltoncostaeaceae bacterium]
MRRIRPLAVAVSLGIATALAATPATAAPAAAPAAAHATESHQLDRQVIENRQIIKRITNLNRSYLILRGRVIVCARPNAAGGAQLKTRAKSELRRTAQLRRAAIANLRPRQRTVIVFRKQTAIRRAVQSLATTSRICAQARRAELRGETVVVTVPGPATPATPAAPAGAPTVQAQVTLGDVLGLGRTFPAGLIPETLRIVDGVVPGTTDLADGVLAIEPDALQRALDRLLAGAVPQCALLDLGCLLNGTLATAGGLLGNIEAAIESGDLGALFRTQDLGGNVVGIVPAGPLAALLNALPIHQIERLLDTEIGVLTLLRDPQ